MSNVIQDIRYDVKNWWWFLVSGLLFIAAGIAVFAWPANAYVSLSILFSILMVSSGFSQIFFSVSNRNILKGWGWVLVSGIIDVVLGTYLLVYPAVTLVTLPYFVGFWLIIRSFYIMGASIDLRSFNVKGWGWLLFGGIVVLALGAFIVYYPVAGVVSIVAMSGSAFVVGGFLNIYLGFQLKDIKAQAARVKEVVNKVTDGYKKVG
jgi:uncharacterized membrane protein HdeD (DUF308 family)